MEALGNSVIIFTLGSDKLWLLSEWIFSGSKVVMGTWLGQRESSTFGMN
jgi:hypothetical protein